MGVSAVDFRSEDQRADDLMFVSASFHIVFLYNKVYFTLSLFTQVYMGNSEPLEKPKKMLRVTLRWTNIPTRVE